jgi:DNA-binding LacI/PurR family transcriptional regulator
MLLGDLNNPFYSAALDEFSVKLQGIGKQVLVFSAATPGAADYAVRRMLEFQVDGLILTAATISMPVTALCHERDVPVVMFNRYVPGFIGNSVCCDNLAGGKLAAETLISAGGVHFAVIAGDANATTSLDRVGGYRKALQSHGFSPPIAEQGHYSYDGGSDAARRLLRQPNPPDSIFCTNDIMALGAIDTARELGFRIPEQLMIIGFDDIAEAARPPYRLTTIRQPMHRMVGAALELLIGPSRAAVTKTLEGQLIRRATVRPE